MTSGSSRTTEPGFFTPSVLEWVNWDALEPRAKAIARRLGPLLAEGYTLKEIGARFERSEDWASQRTRELRREVAAQVLANAGDRLEPELRAQLEQHCLPS